jgi:Glutaminyl-tRNA synthetase, non-specific RNA binding region part 1
MTTAVEIEIVEEKFETSHHDVFILVTMPPGETDPSLKPLEDKFRKIGLNNKLTAEALKSKLIRASLDKTIDETPGDNISSDPTVASLLLALATATQKGTYENRPKVSKAIVDGRIKSARQVEGVNFPFLDFRLTR